MAKKDKGEFTYEIQEFFGSIKESDKHDWAKVVLKMIWGDNPPTLDIRNMNMSQNRPGKGISLTNEEADRLVDLLIDLDYGSLDALEKAVKKRKDIFGEDFDLSSDNSDEYYEVKVG